MPASPTENNVTWYTDTQLVEDLQRGNELAYTQLCLRYRHKVFAFCHRLLLDPDDSKDVLQEVFLKMLNNIHSLQRPDMFRSWLYSIARREAFCHLRRSKRFEKLENDEEVLSHENNPLEVVIVEEVGDIVRHYIAMLRPLYRELLVLREYGGFSCAEISEITGIPENTVRSGLFRARKALAEKLNPIFREEIGDDKNRK
jgi:RNA polymerase sigma-70 factor, ECF subfamily